MPKRVIQTHHLIYANLEHGQQEVSAPIYKGEHLITMLLNRRRHVSCGFVKALKLWLLLNEDKAILLNTPTKKEVNP